jgi:imidazolonepropionase-like amidohydrolase
MNQVNRAALCLFAFAAALTCTASRAHRQQSDATAPAPKNSSKVEGKFRLHKFEQAIGEETYSILQEANGVQVTSSFEFTDRGTKVPLTAKLQTKTDLTPTFFSIQGSVARGNPIDASAEIDDQGIRVRLEKDVNELRLPPKYFFIEGYAPTVMQMMLVRYWDHAGRPNSLMTFPAGAVSIEDSGSDRFQIDGKQVSLERFSIAGLTWGRETLWLDSDKNLAALVSVDAEYDHFEAIRPEYESALGEFVRHAASGEMAKLAEISEKFRSSPGQELLALEGATLVDGTGAAAVPDSVVLVREGKIVAAGPRSKVKIPGNARVLNMSGKTIVPGLWDMHAHFEQVEWGPVYLAAGVTTVRDCGNEFEFITSARDAVASGKGVGPRLLLAGIIDGSGQRALGVARADTPAEAVAWVHRYHDAGFQQMKIYSSVKKEMVPVIAAEAHKLGMTVTGHVPFGMNLYDAVNAGFDQINHISYVFEVMDPDFPKMRFSGKNDELLANLQNFNPDSPDGTKAVAFLKEHGTVIDPTMTIMEMFDRTGQKHFGDFEPGVAKAAPALAEQLKNIGTDMSTAQIRNTLFIDLMKVLTALHRAGVPIVAGTDQSVPGHSVHREMELHVEAGFTPMEALQSATIVSAKAMGLDKEVGTLEPGKRADLVVLGANPLDNISNIRRTEKVMQAGVFYDCPSLWKSVDFQP